MTLDLIFNLLCVVCGSFLLGGLAERWRSVRLIAWMIDQVTFFRAERDHWRDEAEEGRTEEEAEQCEAEPVEECEPVEDEYDPDNWKRR
jgi:hypothetical protein